MFYNSPHRDEWLTCNDFSEFDNSFGFNGVPELYDLLDSDASLIELGPSKY